MHSEPSGRLRLAYDSSSSFPLRDSSGGRDILRAGPGIGSSRARFSFQSGSIGSCKSSRAQAPLSGTAKTTPCLRGFDSRSVPLEPVYAPDSAGCIKPQSAFCRRLRNTKPCISRKACQGELGELRAPAASPRRQVYRRPEAYILPAPLALRGRRSWHQPGAGLGPGFRAGRKRLCATLRRPHRHPRD